MKRNFTYLLPILLACFAGCLSKPAPVVIPPVTVPTGSYTGVFKYYHINTKTGVVDSLIAHLNLKFDASGNYSVSGDTTKHAGSLGKCVLGPTDDLIFTDKTFPATGTPGKMHLDGDYLDSYNGTDLQLLKGVGDSISYRYNFYQSFIDYPSFGYY
jgi:hypothetical protein